MGWKDAIEITPGAAGGAHHCTTKCFDEDGVRKCNFSNDYVPPEPKRREPPVATEVITTACLNLMGAIQSENKSLILHRKALQENLDGAAEARKDMLEFEKAAEGESELIRGLIKKLEGYKDMLVKELSPVPQEVMTEFIGREV